MKFLTAFLDYFSSLFPQRLHVQTDIGSSKLVLNVIVCHRAAELVLAGQNSITFDREVRF
jgi:hypothetical protein